MKKSYSNDPYKLNTSLKRVIYNRVDLGPILDPKKGGFSRGGSKTEADLGAVFYPLSINTLFLGSKNLIYQFIHLLSSAKKGCF